MARANRWRQRRWVRAGGFLAGFALVVLAVAAALRQDPGALRQAMGAIGAHPWWFALLLVALPMLNWLSISASIWVLLSRFGRLGLGEMLTLVGMAWLLNYLPLRPGMIGRVAYHKAVNGIAVRQTGQTLLEGAVITAVAGALMLPMAWAVSDLRVPLAWAMLVLVPMACGALACAVLWPRHELAARYVASGALRAVDMVVWAGRYALTFAIVGAPIDPAAAVILAGASQLAMLVPIAGNGLGLREWLIGALAAGLPAAVLGGQDAHLAQGLTADVLNRLVEVLVAVPVGLGCIGLLVVRLRRLGGWKAVRRADAELP